MPKMDTTHFLSTFSDMVSDFAFMFCYPVGEDNGSLSPPELGYRALITITGTHRGTALIAAPHELCKEFAANSLGVETDHPRVSDHAMDVLGELANLVCGQILMDPTLNEKSPDFSIPEVARIDEGDWQALQEHPKTHKFMIDGEPILFQFDIERVSE